MQKDNRNYVGEAIKLLKEVEELLYKESWRWSKLRDVNDPKSRELCDEKNSTYTYYSLQAMHFAEKLEKLKGRLK